MVVGSGMMGSGIGAMSALAGNRTILVDVDEAHVRSGMEKAMACIDLRVGNGLNTAEEAEEAKKRMETSIDMLKAAASARMVIEAVVEQLEVKQALFAKLDEVLPVEVPICSNTSGLRITDISGTCKKPERTVTTRSVFSPCGGGDGGKDRAGGCRGRSGRTKEMEEITCAGTAGFAGPAGKPCVPGHYPGIGCHCRLRSGQR